MVQDLIILQQSLVSILCAICKPAEVRLILIVNA